jgi:glycosyltransferase involved in cell wall biosynthesis
VKIGFDISQTGHNKAGCGYFADSLIQQLTELDRRNEYILYPYFGTSFWDPAVTRTTRKIHRENVTRKLIGRNFEETAAFWKNLPQNGEEQLGSPEVIHANNFSCPRGIKRARNVYTLYDVHFLEHPEFTTEQNRCVCFEGVFSASIYADFIVAISLYTRDRFLHFFPHYPVERIRAVHLGSRYHGGDSKKQPKSNFKGIEPEAFWLAVGTLEPRKNLRRLLKAFSLYDKQEVSRYPLVLAGGKGWLENDLEDFIQELGIRDKVCLLGYVADEELAWLYNNCFSFVYPSLYEGFGLPVLEAMAFGAVVITSNTTSLPEVAGDAVQYINPLDEQDMVKAFKKIAEDADYRKELKAKAAKQAHKFSWEKTAQEVLDIYSEVAAMPKYGGSFG